MITRSFLKVPAAWMAASSDCRCTRKGSVLPPLRAMEEPARAGMDTRLTQRTATVQRSSESERVRADAALVVRPSARLTAHV